MSELEQQIAANLRRDASVLSRRWRARATAGREASEASRELGEPDELSAGAALVGGVAAVLVGDARGMVGLARAGWQFGSTRYRQSTELVQVLGELQLLDAVVLYAAERYAESVGGSASDGVRTARGVQRGMDLLSRAATKGFTSAWLGAQRQRASTLRHDIRNPLGTIRNAIAFLEDESIPSNLRDEERFRRMIVRNAAQADALISQHLGDGVVVGDALVGQAVSIHDVALVVRRGLREEAREAGVEIVIADSLPVVRVDATAVELALLAAVAGVLERGARHHLSIEPGATRERSVCIRIGAELGAGGDGEGLSLAQDLAEWVGGALSLDDAIVLELPLTQADAR